MRRLALLLALGALAACRATGAPGRALGAETRIVFEGVQAFSRAELLRAIDADRYGDAPPRATRAMVDDAAYAVEELYRSEGYADVVVDYEYTQEEAKNVALLRVEEGQRLTLTEVAFEGNASVETALLERFFLPDGPRPFVKSRLSSAASGIEEYYYQKGWLRARVRTLDHAIERDAGTVRAAVSIHEGPRFHLRSVELEPSPGSPALLPDVRSELAAEIESAAGYPFVPQVGFALRAALLEAYGRRGYPDAAVEQQVTLDGESGDVVVRLVVTPGPQVTVQRVRVQGNEDVRASLVRNRLELREGDAYDSDAMGRSFANLYRTGLFRSARIELEGEGEARDLVVTLQELPSLELFVEPGYGSYEGPRLSLGADERDLLGTGTGLRAEGTVGALAQNASLAWKDPWIDRGRYETRIALLGSHREEPAYTETELGTEWSLARLWSDELRSTLTYRFRRSTLDDVDLDADDPLIQDALEDVNIASVGLSTTLDDRDGLFTPHSGGRKRASIEWATSALGSEIDYLAGDFEASQFFALSERTVLALRFLTGLKAPIGSTESLPLQVRYFNGGENTVRSFSEDELGPLVGGEPSGGEAFTVLNVELRRPIAGNLHGSLFYDTGNVSAKFEDYLDFEDQRHGIGVGLRYLLPIGPVRLDLAWNPSPRGDEDDLVLHFAIGMAF